MPTCERSEMLPHSGPASDGNFQQDNAPCDRAHILSNWFPECDNDFTVLQWFTQSAFLICIEHLWDVEDRRFTSSADRSAAIV